MSGKRPSIATLPTSRTSLAAVAAVALIGVAWGWREYTLLERELANDIAIYETQRKTALEQTVRGALQNLQLRQARVESELRDTLAARVAQAQAVARGICARHVPGKCGEAADEIGDALRAIRFEDGRGYVFAFDLDGIVRVFPPAPQREGAPILSVPGAQPRLVADVLGLAKTGGQGFLRYDWMRPDMPGYGHPKLSFISVFDPLGWAVGAGEYLNDVETTLQAETLAGLEGVRFGETGYVFAGTWEGVALLDPGRGRNMWEVEDKDGLKVVQELVRVARSGGGFVQYTMPPINGGPSYPKISYVAGIPGWQWYVGAGESLESIAKDVTARRAAGQRRILRQVGSVGLVALALAAFIHLRGRTAARRARRDFRRFLDFLDGAATADVALEPERMAFTEFDEMARAANRLLDDKNRALRELEAQRAALDRANEELELRVQARTRDLESEIVERKYAEAELQRINGSLEARVAEGTRHLREQIAARERIESQFIQAQKMEAVGQLAGGFAHDFNNILTIITSTLGLLRSVVGDDDRATRPITLAENATKRAGDLTRRMLVFSREMDSQPETVDLGELVLALRPLIERALRESVEFTATCAPDVWPVAVDPVLLENAVVNVALNAQDAMIDGGRFTLEVANRRLSAAEAAAFPGGRAGDYVELAMSDTGCGISPDVLGRIFEPFFSTKPKGAGTGLGLSMVQAFARRSGGVVQVRSEPSQGTAFSILLPRDPRPALARRPIPAPENAHPFQHLAGLRVLVAEDDPMVRDVTVAALIAQGMEVTAVADGPHALAAIESDGRFDAVVSDLIMPGGMTGLDLREAVRRRWPAIRVLLMTGYSYSEFARRGVDPATVDLLRKPFSRDELLAAIAALEPARAE